MKKFQFSLLTFLISTSSYAYVIGSNLIIENKTSVPLEILIDPPNQQTIPQLLPAHKTTLVYVDNGDHTGLLYQTATAPFVIKALEPEEKIYVHGRIAYYVGASMWNKYSYLNSISAAKNINIDTHYSCKNGGYNTTFENRIVIDGTLENELSITEFPDEVSCEGFKSSTLSDDHQYYTPTCQDGTNSVFTKMDEKKVCAYGHCGMDFVYSSGLQSTISVHVKTANLDVAALQTALDKKAGNTFCASWKIPEDEKEQPPCGFIDCV